MLNLDMNLALETVANLKTAVASYCNIPVDKQVLLISGGESLEVHERVCKYTAGSSDSNPIFLFSVSTLEGSNPPVFSEPYQERDLQPEVESSLSLPDTHNTVNVRTNLAQEYVKVSREQVRLCESEIHDQHLQHQGWAAALANLEDSVLALQKRKASFEDAYSKYIQKREHYRKVIETFDDDIHILSKIPVLPSLYESSKEGSPSPNNGRSSCAYMGQGDKSTSLLDWINQAGNSSLEQVADSCYRSLEQMDAAFLDSFKSKLGSCVEAANNQQMKEIRGLGDRLSGLEQLLLDANNKVSEQKDLAAAFLQNQARASGLKDTSILPDLCASHKQQLLVMMRNHQHIVSIRKRCVKAKEELSLNLYTRLKWVMFIQRQMAESGQQLVLYYEELKRLSRRLEVMEQLHLAPSVYLATVVEVVRRRSFSDHFLKKSSVLAANFSAIHAEELKTRHIFQEKLNKHFLSTMFKGMDDVPPPFATQEPEPFDLNLPNLSLSDLESLRSQLPELAESLSVPDRKTLSSLLTRSLTQNLTQEEGDALANLQNMTNNIRINGDGLGSVSMMNRICYDAVTRKKSRLEALAASRERNLGSDSDSEENETITKGKKISRKMSRSLPSRGEGKIVVAKESAESAVEVKGGDVSSSSVDPSSSTGNTNSSAAPSSDGSLLKQTWPSQTQVDDKCREIEKLQLLLGSAGEEKEKAEARISGLLGISNSGLVALKEQLAQIKSQFEVEKRDVLDLLGEMSRQFTTNLRALQFTDSENKIEFDQERTRRLDVEKELDRTRVQLETELHKLEDCNREIDIYRYQLEDASKALDTAKADRAEDKGKMEQKILEAEGRFEVALREAKESHEARLAEVRQKLELEHELEFDNLKQQIQTGELSKLTDLEGEVVTLRIKLAEKKDTCVELETRAQRLEAETEERIKEEKEKIVQILEAGFSERQRVALSHLETNLSTAHRNELEETLKKDKEDMCSRLEELRQKMIDSSRINLERSLEKKEKEHRELTRVREIELRAQFDEERRGLQLEKQKELEENQEMVRKKSRMELENLRSRFKIMQTTATLDRSPSVSESELSFEAPRPVSQETEDRLEEKLIAERTSWEKERELLREELEGTKLQLRDKQLLNNKEKERQEENMEKILKTEKLRNEAEKQVIFNEAIKKAVEDKDHRIRDLEARLQLRQDRGQNSDLEDQLAQVARKNAQLESELKDANQKLSNNMFASIAVEAEGSLKQLQEENKLLRDQLSRSMTSLISTGKVSVSSADKGEIVLVAWSDPHSNYAIYHEGAVPHFLHTESIDQLGLAAERGVTRVRHITAEVTDKEYCQARKAENRFRVPQGTKFYRVKCKPIDKDPMIKL